MSYIFSIGTIPHFLRVKCGSFVTQHRHRLSALRVTVSPPLGAGFCTGLARVLHLGGEADSMNLVEDTGTTGPRSHRPAQTRHCLAGA